MGTMQTAIKRPSLSEQAVSRLIDPRTNLPLRPLGVVGGRTVWPMMGASPDDPSDKDDKDDDKDSKDSDDDPEGGKDDEDSDESKKDPDAKISALEEEKNRHRRRRLEAEAEAERLRTENAELKGKDQSDAEKATARVTELESENKALTESLREARMQNAFLSDNTYEWHNPGRALSLADLSEVEIDTDGTVHGLKNALKALAKSDAYLLKTKGSETKDEDLPDTSSVKNKSKKKDKDADADDEALLQKYPALRR